MIITVQQLELLCVLVLNLDVTVRRFSSFFIHYFSSIPLGKHWNTTLKYVKFIWIYCYIVIRHFILCRPTSICSWCSKLRNFSILLSFFVYYGVTVAVVALHMMLVVASSSTRGLWALHPQNLHLHEPVGAELSAWEPRDWGQCGDMLQGSILNRFTRPSQRTSRRKRVS
jgi:hypothetical protein